MDKQQKHLWMALQPIVNLDTGDVRAHEALLRGPRGTLWEAPHALFASADRLGQRQALEAYARKLAVARLQDLPPTQKLFLNVDIWDPDMPIVTPPGHIPAERIVIEISERQPVVDNPPLLAQVQRWRAMGHLIALDDYGAGYMGIGALLTLEPDILKLDRVMIAAVHQDRRRQAIVRAMAQLGDALGVAVIAEGVETTEELACVREAGVRWGQGFALGRPQREPRVHVRIPPAR